MTGALEHGGEPYPVLELAEAGSTNREALSHAAAGERGPLWIRADRQTSGRGRSGRAWQSGDGNLAATLLLAPGCHPRELHQLSFLTGVAVHDAICSLSESLKTSGDLRLKWPNDILAGASKLGGILIESHLAGSTAVAAVGIGINIASAPDLAGRQTACLRALGAGVSPRELLCSIDGAMRHWLGMWRQGAGFARIRAAWLERAGPTGERISVNTGQDSVVGVFAGIDETGALLLGSVPANSEPVRRFTYGDVSLLPPSAVEGNPED